MFAIGLAQILDRSVQIRHELLVLLSRLLGFGFESGQNAGLIRTLDFEEEFGRNTLLRLEGFEPFLWAFDPQAFGFLDLDDPSVFRQHLPIRRVQSVEVVAEQHEFAR